MKPTNLSAQCAECKEKNCKFCKHAIKLQDVIKEKQEDAWKKVVPLFDLTEKED